ncbi:very low-density lipoprotein receptor-like isoform X2 [Dreissena polymorpha]|uniref:very low-density lipoprotein receptor-like isoform X2 n=1 Tax=Dreissena polymorpha TaxID=45954 RepID=UPI002263FCFD|nr:very low-density lipoprotein receptor-like isoform X2 [Dreissena polymorpha]
MSTDSRVVYVLHFNIKVLVLCSVAILYATGDGLIFGPKKKRNEVPRATSRPPTPTSTIDYRTAYNVMVRTCERGTNYACNVDPRDPGYQYLSCIPMTQRCDGSRQCPKGDDEDNCDSRCGDKQVRCPDGKCATVCNGVPECAKLQDELACAPLCRAGEVRCSDGACAKVCNGEPECEDSADENRCSITTSARTAAVCQAGEVMCADGSGCARVCNGIPECPGSADEVNCLPRCARSDQVVCQSGKCATACDGNKECVSGNSEVAADELFCERKP